MEYNKNSIKNYFKTFQVYSSSFSPSSLTVSIIISKLFKFIVHSETVDGYDGETEFQNFSSL